MSKSSTNLANFWSSNGKNSVPKRRSGHSVRKVKSKKKKDVGMKSWTVEEVSEWFEKLPFIEDKFCNVAPVVNGAALLLIQGERVEFQEILGLPPGPALQLMEAIRTYEKKEEKTLVQSSSETSELEDSDDSETDTTTKKFKRLFQTKKTKSVEKFVLEPKPPQPTPPSFNSHNSPLSDGKMSGRVTLETTEFARLFDAAKKSKLDLNPKKSPFIDSPNLGKSQQLPPTKKKPATLSHSSGAKLFRENSKKNSKNSFKSSEESSNSKKNTKKSKSVEDSSNSTFPAIKFSAVPKNIKSNTNSKGTPATNSPNSFAAVRAASSAAEKRRAKTIKLAKESQVDQGSRVLNKGEEHVSLIKFYQISSDQYWTFGVDSECTVEDIAHSLAKNLGGEFLIFDRFKDKDTQLENNDNISHRVESWKKKEPDGESHQFIVQQIGAPTLVATTKAIPTSWKRKSTDSPMNSTSNEKLGPILVDEGKDNQFIPFSEIKIVKRISSGSFAKVYKGKYQGNTVAIKVLKGEAITAEIVSNFKKEFHILSSIEAPHLVKFYGASIDKKLSMVMEYCRGGSLYGELNKESFHFSWELLLKYMMQILAGVDSLHSINLVHRDLKSLNLLIDAAGDIKVCDFGLSRFRTMTQLSTLGQLRGTMAYTAPEIYVGELYTAKSDIYSIGIIFWELVYRCINGEYDRPYGEFDHIAFDFQIIIQASTKGLRPTIPPSCPLSAAELIKGTLNEDPEKRPSCKQLIQFVKLLQLEYVHEPVIWDDVILKKAKIINSTSDSQERSEK